MKIRTLIILLLFIAVSMATSSPVFATSPIPRITKEEARPKIDDPNVIFLDVRTGSDWRASGFKIQSAVYEEARNFEKWIENYDPEKTYIVYCA